MDLRANTAVDVLIGPFVDENDGKTAETGLTITQADVKLSKNGQALAQKNDANAAAHDANGYHNCPLNATDLNTEGNLVLIVHESGALPVRHEFNVLSEAAWDSLYAAKDTGYMNVNIKALGDSTQSVTDLKDFADTGYDPATHLAQANTARISGDSAAADNLETMLDGTGGQTLSLGQLRVNSSAAGGAVDIDNSAGPGVSVATSAGNNHGVVVTAFGNAQGIDLTGGATGHGMSIGGGANGNGLVCSGGTAIHANGESYGLRGQASAGRGIQASGTTYGLDVVASAGPALSCVASAGNNDGIIATKAGIGHDIDADIHGTIDTCSANTDMVGTNNAALASVVGALNNAAAAGNPTDADTLMQYLKQLVNVLVGTVGIPAFPAEAGPANNVSLAEVIRAIHADVTGLDGSAMIGTNSAATAAKLLAYIQLLARSDAAITTDNATELTEINANEGSGIGDYAATTESQEALRDRGDAGWVTASGMSTHSAADVWSAADRTLSAPDDYKADVSALSTHNAAAVKTAMEAAGSHLALILADTGTDGVKIADIETGVTHKQALQRIGAIVAGIISGAGTGTETFKGMGVATDRVQVTVDASGNRSVVSYDP